MIYQLGLLTDAERAEMNGFQGDARSFVRRLYLLALERDASEPEIDFQAGVLNAGVSRAQMIANIAGSAEAQTPQRVTSPASPSGVELPHPIVGPGGTAPAPAPTATAPDSGFSLPEIPLWAWGAAAMAAYMYFQRS